MVLTIVEMHLTMLLHFLVPRLPGAVCLISYTIGGCGDVKISFLFNQVTIVVFGSLFEHDRYCCKANPDANEANSFAS